MKIALDIDDVLAGYVIGVHREFDEELKPHNHWSPEESTGRLILNKDQSKGIYTQKYLDKCEHNEDFWYKLPILTLPCDIDFYVSAYITSSPENMVEVREGWLKRHGYPKAPVIHCKKKHDTMQKLGIDLLVDDKLRTVEKIREEGLKAYHFKPWYSTLQEKGSITKLSQI